MFVVKHGRQKTVTIACWAALLLLSLACGIPRARYPGPVPLPPGPDDDAGSPLSNPDRQFPVQASSVNCVAFNPTGHWMATAGEDKIITIWDFSEMRLTLQLRGHADAVTSIAFSPDGKILASGSRDKTVRLWDATRHQGGTASQRSPPSIAGSEARRLEHAPRSFRSDFSE